MTASETAEYRRLVNLWHCTEPMTAQQTERMDYLHELTIKEAQKSSMTQGDSLSSGIRLAATATQTLP